MRQVVNDPATAKPRVLALVNAIFRHDPALVHSLWRSFKGCQPGLRSATGVASERNTFLPGRPRRALTCSTWSCGKSGCRRSASRTTSTV